MYITYIYMYYICIYVVMYITKGQIYIYIYIYLVDSYSLLKDIICIVIPKSSKMYPRGSNMYSYSRLKGSL